MSSHILSEVSDVCDEVAMIDHGKLIVYDTISNVTCQVLRRKQRCRSWFGASSRQQNRNQNIAALPAVVNAEKIDDKNLKITFNGGLDVQERLLNDIVKLNIGVISYKAASSELEEVYLKLITATL